MTLNPNIVHCLKWLCDKTQSYIAKTKRHLAMRVQEHLSGTSGTSAIHQNISSCKDCHSCSISNFFTLAQADVDFEDEIKEASCMKMHTKNKQPNTSLCFFMLVEYCIY